MQRIGVFCGSSPGNQPEYTQAARELGKILAERKIGLVYGGGRVGLMGELASAVLSAGGEVTGVITRYLYQRELAHPGITQLQVVETMHERKALMAELADGFIALPGGLGTIEEIFEVLTWSQLGLQRKPGGLLNVCGYYDALIRFLDHTVFAGFVAAEHRQMILVDTYPARLLDQFENYQPPEIDKVKLVIEETHRSRF